MDKAGLSRQWLNPNQAFSQPPAGAKRASVYTLALLAGIMKAGKECSFTKGARVGCAQRKVELG